MGGVHITSVEIIVKLAVSIIIGLAIGIAVPIVSDKLILKRVEDPLQGAALKKRSSGIISIILSVIICTAVTFTAQSTADIIRNLILVFAIECIAVVDALIRKIPNPLLLIMIITQAVYLGYACITAKDASLLITAGIGFIFGFFVCAISTVIKIPVGAGDTKYSAIIGLCIYFTGYIQSMLLMALFVLAALIVLKATKKGGIKTMIPMGPFLSLGTVITMCFPVLQNYMGSIF